MNWRDLGNSLRDFWVEFKRVKYGIVGVILFAAFTAVAILEPFLTAFPDVNERWRDITYWEDNPKNAAPAWSNLFSSAKKAPQTVLDEPEIERTAKPGSEEQEILFRYRFGYRYPPNDIFLHALGRGTMSLRIGLERPDGRSLEVYSGVHTLGSETPLRISLGKAGAAQALEFAKAYEPFIATSSQEMMRPIEVFFAKAGPGMLDRPEPLAGDYGIRISALLVGSGSCLKEPRLLMTGSVFGLLGTDSSGRDLWTGVIAGTKWALLIGLLTSAVSVIIGIIYGVGSAYFGGWVDALGMRIYDVFQSIPMLPVLIVLSAVFKPSLWILIAVMCGLYWVGPVRTMRSMALQIKEETYIEAARALGASGARIIFRHMIPQMLPYGFALMALNVPGAIVAEATISLLGLGDASIVTWGQILHDAMTSGAMLQGVWWWIIPPGLCIALMGMTFAFVGYALDTILNPKLRTR